DFDDGRKSVEFCSIGPVQSIPAVKNELTNKPPQTPRFSHLVLDFTRLCNSKCTYCGIWKMKDGPELGLEAIKKLFCSLSPFGLSSCYVTGGEPYISDKIVDIARLMHTYLPKCRLSGATNAVQPNKILERMQKILDIGVALEVHVSINGSEATHDATRGGPGFFKKAVYLLETLKSAKLPVVASMSLMPQTIADLPYMQEFCGERDIRLMFSWVRQWERYGTVDNQYSSWPERMKCRLKEIEYLPDTFDCPGLSKRLVVTPDGRVYPCEVYNQKILLGNVNEESPESMLTSGRAASIARFIAKKGCTWCQGAGEVEGSPKWMLMDCYRRHSQQYACLTERFRQAVHMPANESRKVIESILSEKSIHQITASTDQQSPQITSDKTSKVRISAIICTHRNPELLALTIESLLNQTLPRDLFEIIVVDNNSQDQTRQVVQRYGGVRYVLEEKLGLSHARNAGIEAARGDIVAFIDDDAEASPGWLQALLRVYNSVPEAWAVGGKVLPIWDVEKPQWLTERYYRSLSLVEWGQSARPLHWPERIIGTNCSFRRRVFTEIGLFDTSLGRLGRALLGEEDREIQQRIHGLGHLVYYTPRAIVHHHVPASRMTREYFDQRSKGTLVCEEIMALRSQGKHEQASQLSNRLREKAMRCDIIPTQQTALAESSLRLAQFRDKHRGQRCVIIGNGPSLNKMDLSFLKNEITFGMNRIYLLFNKWDFRPTYYVSVNPLVIEQSAGEIYKITSPKFLSLNGLPYVQNHRDNIFLRSVRRPSFSTDPRNGLWEGHTVTYVAMQLAYFMGFSEVILVGVDHYFKTKGAPNKEIVSQGNDENHFHPDYFGKGVRWNLPDLEKSEMAYRLARQAFEAAGRRIIDATVDGHLTIFPKADYREIFFQPAHPVKSVKVGLSAELIDTEFEDYFRNKSESIEPLTATTSPKFAPADIVEQKQRYLVSAIVSTYNSERFLRGCLEDLENQTIADRLEIIIVNSGSQQNEEAIVKEFQQKYDNIVYIRTEQREGIYTAWNRAIRVAHGQFITNANADDRHRRDAFEILGRALEKHHDISLVYADCYVSSTPNETYNENSKRRIYRYPEFSAIGAALYYQFGPQPMWRKKLHETIGYFDESYKAAGDHDFNLRFASHFKALHIAEPLGLYLEHPGAISFRDDIMSQEQRRIASTYRNAETIEGLYKQAGIACDSPEEKARIHLDMGIRALEYYPPWKAGEPERNLEFSLQCFQRAAKLKPDWVAAYNNSAIVLASNGNFQDAAKLLQQVSNSRQDATIDYNLKLISEASPSHRAWSGAKLIPSGLSLPSQRDLSHHQKSSAPPAESLVRLQQKASSKSGKLKVLFYFDRIGNFNESSPAGTVMAILNFARALVRNRPGASINLTGNLVRYPEQYESFQIIPLPQADKRSDFLAGYDVVFFATHIRYFKGLIKPSGQIWVLYQHCWEADDPVSLAHMNDFDAVICLSELHRACLRSQGIGAEKLVTVPNLIDTEIYSPKDVSRNNHSIMYAGGIHPHKCIHTLLGAFQLIRRQVTDAELHIYGDGAMWRGGDDYGKHLKSIKPQGVYFHG
ncbi:MAG: glycosyltransferase, partial [Planctomycetota bacterium]